MEIKSWRFVEMNRGLERRENERHFQSYCNHLHWMAKCSECGKVLAGELQNTTDKKTKEEVEKQIEIESRLKDFIYQLNLKGYQDISKELENILYKK